MKILSRKILLIGALLIMAMVICSLFFYSKRKAFIIGFAYKNDIICVKQSKITLQTVKVDTTNVDSNRVCSFYEVFNYYTLSGNVALRIEIDSASHKLLDTTIMITESNKELFVSFEKPTETKFMRKLFVADEADGSHIKY